MPRKQTPDYTDAEKKLLGDLEQFFAESHLSQGLQESITKAVGSELGNKGEATMAQVKQAISEGALRYTLAQEQQMQQQREQDIFYKPKYRPDVNGAGAAYFQAMDGMDALKEMKDAQITQASERLELAVETPKLMKLVEKSGLTKGR